MGYVGKGSATQVLTDNAASVLPNFQAGNPPPSGGATAWASFSWNGSSITIFNSFNVASITGNDPFTVTWSVAYPDNFYVISIHTYSTTGDALVQPTELNVQASFTTFSNVSHSTTIYGAIIVFGT